MNNFLLAIGFLVVGAIGALFAVPHFVDWNRFRGVFEEEASRFLGRHVRVGGAVSLRLLPTPYFSLEKIRIAEAEAGNGDPFFKADSLNVRLSIAPLLRGNLEANEIEVGGALLHIVLDSKGGGNWQTFGQTDTALPFTIENVALQSVRLVNSSLVVAGADRSERFRLDRIDGEFGAPSLDGPYRFRGTFGAADDRRELRLATVKPDADGAVRFKTSLKHLATGAIYTLDARASDLARAPQIDGELQAQLPLVRAASAGSGAAPPPPVEVKAKVSGNLQALKFADLSVIFEQQGRPQILGGEATVTWTSGLDVATTLSARWLDMDQIVGLEAGASPVSGLLDFAARMHTIGRTGGRTRLELSVDQANLGREAVSGLKVRVDGGADALRIDELRLGLPGGSRADVRGVFAGAAQSASFNGDVAIRGASVARFLGWTTANAVTIDAARDGAFALRTRVMATSGSVVARDLVGELSGTAVAGEVGYTWQGRREITVALEGPTVDLRHILPDKLTLQTVLAGIGAGTISGVSGEDHDAVLRIRAGQLQVPGRVYQDVAADIELRNKRLRISQLKLSAEHGVVLDLEGELVATSRHPEGVLRGVVAAADPAGLGIVADLLGWPSELLPDAASRTALVPFRMAGSVGLGKGGAAALEIAGDGVVGGRDLRIGARFDQGMIAWRTAPLDVSAAVAGGNLEQLAGAFGLRAPLPASGGQDWGAAASAAGAERADLVLRAAGTPAAGLATLVTLNGADGRIGFRGTLAAPEGGLRLTGDLTAQARSGARLAQVLTRAPLAALSGVALNATARLSFADAALRLERIAATVGDAEIAGQLTLTTLATGRRIEGRLDLGVVQMQALLAPLLDQQRPAAAEAAIAIASGRQGAWPDEPFDLSILDTLSGSVDVSARRIVLGDGVGLDRARMSVALAPGRIELRALEGAALGGRWSGGVKLERAAAGGAELQAGLRVTGGRIEALVSEAGQTPRGSGVFNGVLTLSGRGLGPRGLASALAGGGSVDLGATRLEQVSPAQLAAAIDAAMRGNADALSPNLRQQLTLPQPAPGLAIAARALPFDVAEGVLRFRPFSLDSREGRASAALRLDLASLIGEVEWRIETQPQALAPLPSVSAGLPTGAPAKPAPQLTALPAVVFTTAGPVGTLARSTAVLKTDAIERELAVRKMERDLDELERLRKLDELRAAEEAERRRLLEINAQQPLVMLPPDAATGSIPGSPVATPAGTTAAEASTMPVPLADTVDPTLKPRAVTPASPATPSSASPLPKYRPMGAEEMKRIFGGG